MAEKTSILNSNGTIRNLIGSLTVSVIVVVIGFALNSRYSDTVELRRQLNLKVDKVEYTKTIEILQNELKEYDKLQRQQNEDIKLLLNELSNQNAAIKTDIEWIKREMNNDKFANR
jgi:hypothetical protein